MPFFSFSFLCLSLFNPRDYTMAQAAFSRMRFPLESYPELTRICNAYSTLHYRFNNIFIYIFIYIIYIIGIFFFIYIYIFLYVQRAACLVGL